MSKNADDAKIYNMLVSVQPMMLPSDFIFHMQYKFDAKK